MIEVLPPSACNRSLTPFRPYRAFKLLPFRPLSQLLLHPLFLPYPTLIIHTPSRSGAADAVSARGAALIRGAGFASPTSNRVHGGEKGGGVRAGVAGVEGGQVEEVK